MGDALQTASQRIIADAGATAEVTDGLGRKIIIGKMSVIDQARLAKAVGAEHSGNESFMQFARAACCIRNVDGVQYPMPKTAAEVEAAIIRMGDAAYLLVVLQVNRWMQAASESLEEAIKASFADNVKN